MKKIIYILIILLINSCKSQVDIIEVGNLSISPTVDLTKFENKNIIFILEEFLNTKNQSLIENKYWLSSDFEKYKYPYRDIYQIEKYVDKDNYFHPSLMELISINENEKLLKIAFIGVSDETDERLLRCIYNIVAIKHQNTWKLKRAIDHQTHDWHTINKGSVHYRLPKNKNANQAEMEKQIIDISNLCLFFETEPISITYYSCYNPKQVFEVKGFDYYPNMFYSKTGGMADDGNIIYSGNNSEYYTHEIVHIYTQKLFANRESFLDEGIATYIGGSGIYDYKWHRAKFKEYLGTSQIDLSEHTKPFERLYIADETSIPYLIAALICERTLRVYGKKKLFELLDIRDDLWVKLNKVGLTKENLTTEIKNELKLPPTKYMR